MHVLWESPPGTTIIALEPGPDGITLRATLDNGEVHIIDLRAPDGATVH
jgi:hypothetical protein